MKEGWGGSYRGRSGERLGVQVPTKPEAPRRVLGMVQDTQTINQGRMEGGRVGEREEGHTPNGMCNGMVGACARKYLVLLVLGDRISGAFNHHGVRPDHYCRAQILCVPPPPPHSARSTSR